MTDIAGNMFNGASYAACLVSLLSSLPQGNVQMDIDTNSADQELTARVDDVLKDLYTASQPDADEEEVDLVS